MADQTSAAYTLLSKPGVQRDGTLFASASYTDGEWVRFQRGVPRKMGGYRSLSSLIKAPVRSVLVDSRNALNTAHLFSPWGIQSMQFASLGSGGPVVDRTPLEGFLPDARYTWTHATMFSGVGARYAAVIAAATPDVNDVASDNVGGVYAAHIATRQPFEPVYYRFTEGSDVQPLRVSGGVTVLQPFLVAYGSNGLIMNSNPNDFSMDTGWLQGGGNFANTANVAGTKIVFGMPQRGGGQAPAGLFWALDALIRMSFVGGQQVWQYDTVAHPISILSKKSVVELNGQYFWPGVDRFFVYGGAVQELPNLMNSNWFFEGLNRAYANKVWGAKIPRYGELWWFYPRGEDTECNDAIIYNYREQCWYDAHLFRTAGDISNALGRPLWAGGLSVDTTAIRTGYGLLTNEPALAGTSELHLPTARVRAGLEVMNGTGITPGDLIAAVTDFESFSVTTPLTEDTVVGELLTLKTAVTATGDAAAGSYNIPANFGSAVVGMRVTGPVRDKTPLPDGAYVDSIISGAALTLSQPLQGPVFSGDSFTFTTYAPILATATGGTNALYVPTGNLRAGMELSGIPQLDAGTLIDTIVSAGEVTLTKNLLGNVTEIGVSVVATSTLVTSTTSDAGSTTLNIATATVSAGCGVTGPVRPSPDPIVGGTTIAAIPDAATLRLSVPLAGPLLTGDTLVLETQVAVQKVSLAGTSVVYAYTGKLETGMRVAGPVGIPANTYIASVDDPDTVSLDDGDGTPVALAADIAQGEVVYVTTTMVDFAVGERVTGSDSSGSGIVADVSETELTLRDVSPDFQNGDALTGDRGGAAIALQVSQQKAANTYVHETGWDRVEGQDTFAIRSSYTTHAFGFAVGDPVAQSPKSMSNVMTRVPKVEADFDQFGTMRVEVQARNYASEEPKVVASADIEQGNPFVDLRGQGRILTVKFSNLSIGGFYEAGRVLAELAPGDGRTGFKT